MTAWPRELSSSAKPSNWVPILAHLGDDRFVSRTAATAVLDPLQHHGDRR
jgi:hypothetical protein